MGPTITTLPILRAPSPPIYCKDVLKVPASANPVSANRNSDIVDVDVVLVVEHGISWSLPPTGTPALSGIIIANQNHNR